MNENSKKLMNQLLIPASIVLYFAALILVSRFHVGNTLVVMLVGAALILFGAIYTGKGRHSASLLMVFAVSFALYYFFEKYSLSYYNSDSAVGIIMGKDMVSGNILLKDWYGSRNAHLLCVVYGILGEIVGYSWNLLPLVMALLWAGMLTLIADILLSLYASSKSQTVARICLAFILCFSSIYAWKADRLLGGAHFDVVLFGIFYIYVISKEIKSCKNDTPRLLVASALLFFILLVDKNTQVFIIVPVLATLLFELLFCVDKNGGGRDDFILQNT